MKKNNLLNVISVLLIVGAGFACKIPFGKNKAVGTGNIRDPNTICAFLNDMNFETDEYKKFTDDYYSCSGTTPEKVFYNPTGDAVGVTEIKIAVLPEAKPDAAPKNAETVVRATGAVWRKLLSKPLPEEISQAILTAKGKKRFTDPIQVTVDHDPNLLVTIKMPDEELLNRLKAKETKAAPTFSTAAPVTAGLKAPEPCGYFEQSLGIKAEQYRSSSGEQYSCSQLKKLANSSTFRFQAYGNATFINTLVLDIFIFPQNTDAEKREMSQMLSSAAIEIADKASGQKLNAELIPAILFGESRDFTLAPGADGATPQIRTVSVVTDPQDSSKVIIKHVIFRF